MQYRFSADDVEMLQAFIEEAGEYLQRVEEELLKLEVSDGTPGVLNDIFRQVHTLKGLASFFGFAEITRLSHQAEYVLDALRSDRIQLNSSIVELLLNAGDALGEMIRLLQESCEKWNAGTVLEIELTCSQDVEKLIQDLESIIPPKPSASGGATASTTVQDSSEPEGGTPSDRENAEKGTETEASVGQASNAPNAPNVAVVQEGSDLPVASDRNLVTVNQDTHIDRELMALVKGQASAAAAENFLTDADEHSEIICGKLLIDLDGNPGDMAALADLFRRVHTLKGNLGLLLSFQGPDAPLRTAAKETMEVFQRMEELLEKMRTLRLPVPVWVTDICFACMDALQRLMAMMRSGQMEADPANPPLLKELAAARERLDAETSTVPLQNESTLAAPGEPEKSKQNDRELSPIGMTNSTDHKTDKSPSEQVSAGDRGDRSLNTTPGEDKSNRASEKTQGDSGGRNNAKDGSPSCPSKRTGSDSIHGTTGHSIRVSEEKINRLMNAIAELAVTKNAFSQIARKLMMEHNLPVISREVKDAGQWVSRISAELEDAIMAMRMTEVRTVFQKFPRVIRDIALQTGKRISLIMEGEDTELDKTIIDQIGDPLMHLVRNAADHGIEPESERIAKGKDPQGRVWLRAYSRGKYVFIEIEDDGKGLNPQALKEKAVEKGFITAAQAEDMNETQAYQLIFLPGFSTAKAVSEISGRGVGMDVVRNNITALRGTISISSQLGKGTKLVMQLPLTLVVSRGLMVEVADQMLILPLDNVLETLKVPGERLLMYRGRKLLHHRGEVLGVVSLAEVIGMGQEELTERTPVVIVTDGHVKVGLIVNRLIGEQDVLVKPLPDYLSSLPGMGGGTIMGDGRVALVMNPIELIKMATGTIHKNILKGDENDG
ncbi:chemotaxis protein CheA [Heliobacterium chlorum]|uniref:histidine kinase n=1 Tax=Heliobacterium chlorum TaxID=2698 RepID=A0ABR7T642_HELCL|nr:chemotaxis protein CheA [Heliobacterium chlorum]MBC9785304.1 chemotaxis protein CheA [Heliobacterium chlorum]